MPNNHPRTKNVNTCKLYLNAEMGGEKQKFNYYLGVADKNAVCGRASGKHP